jgi:hypothetical protein
MNPAQRLLPLLNALITARGIACLALIFGALVIALCWRTPARQFRYFILHPIPPTVGNIIYEDDDWFRINPEPVAFIRFTASHADLEHIIRVGGFKPVKESFDPGGPPWWDHAKFGTSVQTYVRQHGPKGEPVLYIGKSRHWTEVLRIHSTNAYFLVFGI